MINIVGGNPFLVSVIVPAYNSANTIEQALVSACDQTMRSLEILVIIDPSIDDTVDVVLRLKENDSRIHLIRNTERKGLAESRNIGIALSKGKYIAFLDSDDIWVKNKLELQLQIMLKYSAQFCYSSYSIINDSGVIVSNFIVPSATSYSDLLKQNVIGCSTVVVERTVLPDKPFSVEFFHEDYVLWLSIFRDGTLKNTGIQDVQVIYRQGGRSSDKLNAAKNRWIVLRKVENLSLFRSIYNFILYTWNGIKKHKKVRFKK